MINSYRTMIIAVEESNSTVAFFDSATAEEIGRVAVGHWPHEIDVSSDGSLAYVSNFGVKDYDENIGVPGESISIIDLSTLCEIERLFTFRSKEEWRNWRAPHGVKISPDGTRLYVNVERGNKMLVYDLLSASKRTPCVAFELPRPQENTQDLFGLSFNLPEKTHNFIFSIDGAYLFVASGFAGMTKIDAETGDIKARLVLDNSAIRGIAYTPDKRRLIVSGSGELCLVYPETLEVDKRFTGFGIRQFLYSRPTHDGKFILAPAVWEGQLLKVDAERGDVVGQLIVGADPIHLAIPKGGATVFLSHGRSKFISEIDIDSFSEIRRIPTLGGPNGIAVAPLRIPRPKRTLKVGTCIPLSGASASEGQDMRLGYQFWQETLNAAGGILSDGECFNIEVILRDTKSGTKDNEIRPLAEDLVHQAGVDFIFGSYPSPPNEHVARVCEEQGIPFITASGAAEEIYNKGFTYLFGIMTSANSFLKGAFEYLDTLANKPRSALFLTCKDLAALQDAHTTASIVEKRGVKILVPEGTQASVDGNVLCYAHLQDSSPASLAQLKNVFRSVLEKAVGVQLPDVFVNTGHLPEAVALVQVAKEMNYCPKGFAFSVGPAVPDFVTQLTTLAQNLMGSAMWSPEQDEAGHDRFVRPEAFARVFFDRFSKRPSHLAAGAVACGVVLEDAIRRAGSKQPCRVRDALIETNLDTFYSNIQFDDRGLNAKRPLVTIQLRIIAGEMTQVVLWPSSLAGANVGVWPFPGWESSQPSSEKQA